MGWLWGSGDSPKDTLDPSLRDFLDKQAPTGQRPALPTKAPPKPAEQPSKTTQTAEQAVASQPAVPEQSQFPDGRYAHLWKNYTPQGILEDRGKTDQDRLRDIVDAYNDKKASVGRVAMENCAVEYMAQFECFKNPSAWQLGTLCRAESKKFNRCYEMQGKFLKALGYLSIDERNQEDSERIQMHADKLYQQFLEQEAAINKATEEGKPIPKFESVLSPRNVAQSLPRPSAKQDNKAPLTDDELWKDVKDDARERYEKKLAELPPEQQEIERQAVTMELRAQSGLHKQVEVTFEEERIARMKRKEQGQATIGDTIKSLWGW